MQTQMNTDFGSDENQISSYLSFDSETETLLVDDVEIQVDFLLGDDDLGVSLLLESLEQQYQDLVDDPWSDEDRVLNLQSTKEWVRYYRDQLADLLRYVKSLMLDKNECRGNRHGIC